MRVAVFTGALLVGLLATAALAQTPDKDSSVIDSSGTAHITRIVPVPNTVSPEAQKAIGTPASDAAVEETMAQHRAATDKWQNETAALSRKKYPVADIKLGTIAGVQVRVLTPLMIPAAKRDRVLINLHGGGFNSDAGSLTETIPIANLTQTRVIAVLYRLSPENHFPAALDDAMAVYKDTLKTHRPRDIAVYGTSAGAQLTAEFAAQVKKLGLPEPAALGIFSGVGDASRAGDSRAIYALHGLAGHLDPPTMGGKAYLGEASPTDPIVSPLFSDLHGMPPTLFVTSTRDMLLSSTTILHRAYLRAGVDARLVVFEGMSHAFWNNPVFPESEEANRLMADFFDRQLGRK